MSGRSLLPQRQHVNGIEVEEYHVDIKRDVHAYMPLFDDEQHIKRFFVSSFLEHQLQALQWCIERESGTHSRDKTSGPEESEQKRSREGKAKNHSIQSPSHLVRGGILADDVGFGKTLTSSVYYKQLREEQGVRIDVRDD
ncbi:hypothetical protein CBS101457_005572 [Exobasidium rhododendri]|nr:hypothetical protein CBS101457_005572 [Exobasidium rhododendri]